MAKYKRVLLKLSGEALAGPNKTGFDEATCLEVARQVKSLVEDGVQVAIVTGGGNFWRGRTSETIDRTKADQIGMLATVMNCVYVSDIFRYVGLKTSVMTPFVCGAFTELFSKDKAVKALEAGEVVFFAGGTGHPYFSTDTATVLRAIEIEADVSWNETAWYPFKNQHRRSGRGINDHASAKKCGSGGTCYDVFWTVVSVIADQTVNIG